VVARSAGRLIALLVVLRASLFLLLSVQGSLALLILLAITALIHAVAVVPALAILAYGIRS
jgi:hypothetical protein